MKIATGGSPYLSKDDLAEPIIATVECVTINPTLRDKYVLHFAEEEIKPLTLNATNRRTLMEAFGADDEAWQGRQIEVYVDPNVKSPVVGGIRVRIP